MLKNWYEIENVQEIVTPCLVIYEERVIANIEKCLAWVNNKPERIRPHIKTNKSVDVCKFLLSKGINKIKASTITEVKIGIEAGFNDILLSHPLTKPKAKLFFELIEKHPNIRFSTIVDSENQVLWLSEIAKDRKAVLDIYLDINSGMNRTGFNINGDISLFVKNCKTYQNINFKGFHSYDGHIKVQNLEERKNICQKSLDILRKHTSNNEFEIIAGGSNTFPCYASESDVVCSPGTFVFWDQNYVDHFPEQPFEPAALILGTVISLPKEHLATIDIGYKAISAENPIENRMRILNFHNSALLAHSEEHAVLTNMESDSMVLNSVVYVLPYHICPAVALYSNAILIKNGKIVKYLKIKNHRN